MNLKTPSYFPILNANICIIHSEKPHSFPYSLILSPLPHSFISIWWTIIIMVISNSNKDSFHFAVIKCLRQCSTCDQPTRRDNWDVLASCCRPKVYQQIPSPPPQQTLIIFIRSFFFMIILWLKEKWLRD